MNFNTQKNQQQGITIIEAVIYVAILAVVTVVVVNTIILSINAFGKSRVKKNISTQGRAVMERTLREIRLASSIDTAGSVLTTSPGTLKLNTIVSPTDVTITTRTFSLSSSTIMVQEGAATTSPLTTGVTVDALTFYSVAGTATSTPYPVVRVEMTLSDTVGRFQAQQTLYGTATMRGSY